MTVKVVYKAAELQAAGDDQYEFVASDETTDRYGDVVRVAGWELSNYKRNPIVLFQHQPSNPVGIASKVWIDGKKLMSRVKLAVEGTSPFIDSLRKLLAQKIIRAVSVGFMPTADPRYIRDPENDRVIGLEFVGQELMEISLVSIPANPNALSLAKSLNIPELHLQRVFNTSLAGKQDASVFLQNKSAELDILRARRRAYT